MVVGRVGIYLRVCMSPVYLRVYEPGIPQGVVGRRVYLRVW